MGKRNDWFSLSLELFSRFWIFFVVVVDELSCFLNETTKTKEGGERESFALSLGGGVANKKYLWKYLTKGKKEEEKKHPFKGKKIFSLCSLCLKGGRASSLLHRRRRHHQPSLWNTEQHEKKESREQHEDAKIPTSGGERKCCWAFFYWSREVCVCARFPPLISLRKAYLLVSSFRQFFFFLVGKLPFWNLPFLSLIFFSVVSEREGNEERKSTQKITTARVRRASTTLST